MPSNNSIFLDEHDTSRSDFQEKIAIYETQRVFKLWLFVEYYLVSLYF